MGQSASRVIRQRALARMAWHGKTPLRCREVADVVDDVGAEGRDVRTQLKAAGIDRSQLLTDVGFDLERLLGLVPVDWRIAQHAGTRMLGLIRPSFDGQRTIRGCLGQALL